MRSVSADKYAYLLTAVVMLSIAIVMLSVHLFKHHVEISIGRIVDVFIE